MKSYYLFFNMLTNAIGAKEYVTCSVIDHFINFQAVYSKCNANTTFVSNHIDRFILCHSLPLTISI